MDLKLGIRLSKEDVYTLLTYFDYSSSEPLHESLDFYSYKDKLSENAFFILATESSQWIGFIAYYLNDEEKYIYVPQVVVVEGFKHKGVGHKMFNALYSHYWDCAKYETIRLEVLKDNIIGRKFYKKEGFVEVEDRGKRLLLSKELHALL